MMVPLPSWHPSYLRTGFTRLARNAFTTFWLPRSGWSPPPVLAVLRPTDACNLQCRTCFDRGDQTVCASWPEGRQEPAPSLSVCAWQALVVELIRSRCSFYLTGGEPLLSAATLPIVAAIKAGGGYVSLNTNGVLLEKYADELVGSGLDKIILSLDGPREIHDSVRGPSFDAIAAGVAAIREAQRRRNRRTPVVRAQCVVSPHNVNYLYETMKAVRSLGLFEIRFQHLMFVSNRDSFQVGDFLKHGAIRTRLSSLLLAPDALDVTALRAQLSLVGQESGVQVGFEPPLKLADLPSYYNESAEGLYKGCLSPWRRIIVSPQGEIGPCQGVFLGQYPAEGALEIWNGPAFRSFRRQLIERGLFAFCSRCCHREYYKPKVGLTVN
jgi:Fe-coproporphyrin III synthase